MSVLGMTRRIDAFCRVRVASVCPPLEAAAVRTYLVKLIDEREVPPRLFGRYAWDAIASKAGLSATAMSSISDAISPALDMLCREIPKLPRPRDKKSASKAPSKRRASRISVAPLADRTAMRKDEASPVASGRKPAPVVIHPSPKWETWDDPDSFSEALDLHMRRHGDSSWRLHRAIIGRDEVFDLKTIRTWRTGRRCPQSSESIKVLGRIEKRYRLPAGYFQQKLPNKSRSISRARAAGIPAAEQRRLAWHLPADFNDRSSTERDEILHWVRNVVVSGATDYRRYQSAAMKNRYGLRFPGLLGTQRLYRKGRFSEVTAAAGDAGLDAPPVLVAEMADLIRFKTSTLALGGVKRNGVWGDETASQKIEHIGLMLGALAASTNGSVRGAGVPLQSLSLALLIMPPIWDWYLHWRERRRGFFTNWEVDMLRFALAITRKETGWLRQRSDLAERLEPIPNLVSETDVKSASGDWEQACEQLHQHAAVRVKEVDRVARVHRDPFEPILPILEAENPLAEYRKITEEIVRIIPEARRYPIAHAEAVRSFLMLRLGLHLGVRQKNLRQLLFCPRGRVPMTERQLEDRKRGELRWSERESAWEVVIPAIAFKNSTSSYFGNKPYRLVLQDLADLYTYMDAYVERGRKVLLRGAEDPGTFFVKTVKTTSANAEYDQNTFYEAWRLTIQRYGIYNPYTERGAIKGLLPHGPHNLRDVLATHILKKTGSFEQASYAIQDTPEMVARHYGRFLPQDKAALAARILNKVWSE